MIQAKKYDQGRSNANIGPGHLNAVACPVLDGLHLEYKAVTKAERFSADHRLTYVYSMLMHNQFNRGVLKL